MNVRLNLTVLVLVGILVYVADAGGRYGRRRPKKPKKIKMCPSVYSCKDKCSSDRDCRSNEKCCSDGCQKVCVKPQKSLCKYGETGDTCGGYGNVKCSPSYTTECKFKSYLSSTGTCCYTRPQYGISSSSGSCPPYSGCKSTCDSDRDCSRKQKCCNDGCRKSCMKPVKGFPPVSQPDDCTDRGERHDHGDTWSRDCNTCSCNNGRVACSERDCTPTSDCIVNGRRYEDGETIPKSDPCLSCHCDDGEELCSSQSCAANCPRPVRRPGVCCPVCPDEPDDCVDNQGVTHPHDSDWQVNCNTCTCTDGNIACTLVLCGPDDCVDNQGVTHPHSSDWQIDCNTCRCNNGNIACTRMSCGPDDCVDNQDVTRPDGSSWQVECNTCRCTDGNIRCTSLDCSDCVVDGRRFQDGDDIPNDDPCTTCTCDDGEEQCVSASCALPTCPNGGNPVPLPGVCCPVCPRNCQDGFRTRDHGSSWQVDCNTCICDNGEISCTEIACPTDIPAPDCSNPANNFQGWREGCDTCVCLGGRPRCSRGRDCPPPGVCTDRGGRLRDDGDIWLSFEDRGTCRNCTCNGATAPCVAFRCPRQGPCTYDGQSYNHRQTWRDGCRECECWYTIAECYSRNC